MKKKILFLIHSLQSGGAERSLVNLVNSLNKKKYDVSVQTLFDVGVLRKELDSSVTYIPGFKKLFRGNVSLSKLLTPKQLCRLLIKDEYDLVVSYLEGQCCRILSEYEGKKIAWIHIEHNSKDDIIHPFRDYEEAKECYSKFDKIICVAKTVENNFNYYFELSEKTETIHNIVDVEKIVELGKENQGLIVQNENCYNLISVGRLINSHKGFDRLIRIHKKLLNSGINNKLYIVGSGEDKKAIEVLIDELEVENSVYLTGYTNNPYKYISKSDLFVCASHKEGFSTACAEALILGVPVVSTMVSGAEELVEGKCGIVCDNTEEALYNCLRELLTDKKRLSNYRENAINKSKRFNGKQLNFETVFDSVI